MYLCIDIGGTKTLVALMNNHRKILHSIRFSTAFDQDHFFENLINEIRTNFAIKELEAISVGVPGPTENNQILWLGNLPWTNFDLGAKLKDIFRAPVYIENDANLAGLAEAENIPGLSVFLTLSTGIGGGVIKDGSIDPSIRIYEPGHDKYIFNGQLLEWEDFASAKAIYEYYGKLTTEIKSRADWVEISCRIATGMHSVISCIRPDTIILGGPLGLAFKKYRQPLEKQLSVALPASVSMPKLLIAKYKDKSVIFGCFIYAQQQTTSK